MRHDDLFATDILPRSQDTGRATAETQAEPRHGAASGHPDEQRPMVQKSMGGETDGRPDGLATCIRHTVINGGAEWFTISIGLPHYLALAETVEAEGRAAGSTRLRGLGVPIPIQAEPGIVRLWAKWRKLCDGSAMLHDIEIRAGKERNGEHIVNLHHSSGGAFGSRFGMYTDRDSYPRRRARLLATCHALDAFAALAGEQDALTVAGRMGAIGGFCMCCGRMLTDPLSVDMGIGPECAGLVRRAALETWKRRRAGGLS